MLQIKLAVSQRGTNSILTGLKYSYTIEAKGGSYTCCESKGSLQLQVLYYYTCTLDFYFSRVGFGGGGIANPKRWKYYPVPSMTDIPTDI